MMHDVVDNLELLKSLEEAVKDPEHILTKDVINPITNTRQREALTLFLTSEVLNESFRQNGGKTVLEVCKSDSSEDRLDGFLRVTEGDATSEELEFEQVLLTKEEIKNTSEDTDISELIIEKIKQKHKKHYDHPKGITLVVFLDLKGQTIPEKIKQYLKDNNEFMFYILIALGTETPKGGSYVYKVIDLNPLREGNHSRFVLEINNSFDDYSVRLEE